MKTLPHLLMLKVRLICNWIFLTK